MLSPLKLTGFGIIEIIVAMGLFAIIAVTAITTTIGSFSTNRLSSESDQATLLAQEGIEAALSIKRQGWSSPFLTTDCSSGCGITAGGGSWTWSGSNNVINQFTRVVTISDAQRDGSDTIVASGGTNDTDTKKITSTVSWDFSPGRNNSITLEKYVTNYLKFIISDWSTPLLESSFDLTAANSSDNNSNGQAVNFVNNHVLLGRVSNAGTELFAVDVTNPALPTMCGANCRRELGGTVFDIEVSGSYAYIANSNNSQELQIINIANPANLSSASLTTFDLTAGNSGNATADPVAVAISGTNLYMVRNGGNEFLRFDISNPLAPSLTGSDNDLVGTLSDMVIVGSYAYVTSNDNSAELQVVELSSLNRVAVLDMNSGNNTADASSLSITNSTNHLLVGRVSSGAPELYSISISTPTSPAVLSTTEIGGSIYDVVFAYDYIFLGTSTASDFMVIDGSNLNSLPALPALGTVGLNNSPVDLHYEQNLDRVVIASSDNSQELQIIAP